jgi:hypothetical protein
LPKPKLAETLAPASLVLAVAPQAPASALLFAVPKPKPPAATSFPVLVVAAPKLAIGTAFFSLPFSPPSAALAAVTVDRAEGPWPSAVSAPFVAAGVLLAAAGSAGLHGLMLGAAGVLLKIR